MTLLRTGIGLLFILASATAQAQAVDLRLSGSNTIGAALAPQLARDWLRSHGFDRVQRIELAELEIRLVGTNAQGGQRAVEIAAHGSGTSFRALKAGIADIGMSSRPIRESERVSLGITERYSSLSNEHVIGLDGIAIVVHPDSPLRSITIAQLRAIFSGQITNWAELGLPGGSIQVYARDDKSGTFDTFDSLVMADAAIATSARRYESTSDLSDDVSNDPNGIGFVGLPYVRSSRAVAVKNGASRPTAAEEFTIATEDYALARRLFLYTPKAGDITPLAQDFVNFAVSERGQRLVESTGFVAQRIVEARPTALMGAPDEYLTMTDTALRLSLNFRFHPSATTLDSKGVADLNRLVEYLQRPGQLQRSVLLAGFADASEVSPYLSLALSNDRADYVARLLVNRGVRVERVRGFGPALPVADNQSSNGRGKNRRVEVWLSTPAMSGGNAPVSQLAER